MKTSSVTTKPSRNLPFRKYIIPFIFLLVLVFGLIVTSIFVRRPQKLDTKASADLVDLSLIASSSQIEVGQVFTVNILINTHNYTVSAAELHLKFSNNLEAISFTPTDFLPVILMPAQLENTTASLIIGSEPTNPKKGGGILANLTLKAKNLGPAIIEFDPSTQIAAIESQTDVVGDLNPVSFAVVSPTPTLTPTPTSTPTPVPTLTPTPTSTPMPTPTPTQTPTPTPTPTPIPLPGDINHDGKVDIFDYNLLLENFSWEGNPGGNIADLDRDGDVDIFDYNVLLEHFGEHQ